MRLRSVYRYHIFILISNGGYYFLFVRDTVIQRNEAASYALRQGLGTASIAQSPSEHTEMRNSPPLQLLLGPLPLCLI